VRFQKSFSLGRLAIKEIVDGSISYEAHLVVGAGRSLPGLPTRTKESTTDVIERGPNRNYRLALTWQKEDHDELQDNVRRLGYWWTRWPDSRAIMRCGFHGSRGEPNPGFVR
jgi:hypothetical protein